MLQTTKLETLQSALRAGGPAIAALVPEGAAEFIHIPDPKLPLHQRLTVSFVPSARRKAIDAWSSWQQEQELEQLLQLAAPPLVASGGDGNGKSPSSSDPVDRLANWLLTQANLASA